MKSLWILPVLLLFAACDRNGGTAGSACESDFDRRALYVNLADNLILPGYAALTSDAIVLNARATDFLGNPNPTTLTSLRVAFQNAWLSWQDVEPYGFGPAESSLWRARFNNFPLNVEDTEQRIAAQDYDFAQETFTQGFPALDYLLFGGEDEAAIIARFIDNVDYRVYLLELTDDLQRTVNAVAEEWEQGYRDRFVENDGTAAGTSLSQVVNGLNQHYEFIKRERFGIPSGVLTIGIANPDRVEARWSGISKELAERALRASYQFYLGDSGDNDRPGLDDYLRAIDAPKGDTTLDEAIRAQYETALVTLAGLDGTLAAIAAEDPAPLVRVYNEITKNLVALKTDLPSVLCVSITYVDNPSDSD